MFRTNRFITRQNWPPNWPHLVTSIHVLVFANQVPDANTIANTETPECKFIYQRTTVSQQRKQKIIFFCRSGAFIVNFENILHLALVFLF